MNVKEVFATRLKELRKQRGASRRRVTIATGISEAALRNYEIDGASPSLESLVILADYFGVSTDYLLGRIDNDHRTSN